MIRTVIFLSLLLPGIAEACSCIHADFSILINSSNYIFVAEITSTRIGEQNHEVRTVLAKYNLLESLKGDPSMIPEISTSLSGGGGCGFDLIPGVPYLIFTNGTVPLSWYSGTERLTTKYGKDKKPFYNWKQVEAVKNFLTFGTIPSDKK